MIVASLNVGPQNRINEHKTSKGEDWGGSDTKPGLAQWSDVVWLTWAKATTDDQRPKLQVICQRLCVNTETKNLIAYILSERFQQDPVASTGRAPKWSNAEPSYKTIRPGDFGFKALLSRRICEEYCGY